MSNEIYKSARIAARKLNRISAEKINALLMNLADAVEANIEQILDKRKYIGDGIFLTRAEAESRLKELESE